MAADADDDTEVLLLQRACVSSSCCFKATHPKEETKKPRFWARAIFKERRRYGAYHFEFII